MSWALVDSIPHMLNVLWCLHRFYTPSWFSVQSKRFNAKPIHPVLDGVTIGYPQMSPDIEMASKQSLYHDSRVTVLKETSL
jgi:hypothetical protein